MLALAGLHPIAGNYDCLIFGFSDMNGSLIFVDYF